MFTVMLDACVLVPMTLTDTILSIAETESVDVRWSPTILSEVRRTLIRLGLAQEKADRRIRVMRREFPQAEVTGFSALEPILANDPKDRHVLAATIRAGIDTIVTFNLKDFPEDSLRPWGISAIHPDEFLLDQLDLAPGITMASIMRQLSSYSDPPWAIDDLLSALSRCGVPDFADEVRRHLSD